MRYMIAALALASLGTAAVAAPAKLDVDLGYFPKGTECTVSGTTGKVKMRQKRKEMKFTIKGDTGNVTFDCTEPEGASFRVQTGPLLPETTAGYITMQINRDGKAAAFWDDGGLRMQKHTNVVKWR